MTVMLIPIKDNRECLLLRAGLSGGTDFSYIQHKGENIRIRTDQLWFWSNEWQMRHEEAIADLDEGRYTVYETGSDFLAAMDEAIARNEAKARNS